MRRLLVSRGRGGVDRAAVGVRAGVPAVLEAGAYGDEAEVVGQRAAGDGLARAGEVLDPPLGRRRVELADGHGHPRLAEGTEAAPRRPRVGEPVGVEEDPGGGERAAAGLEVADLGRDAERVARAELG